MNNVNEQRQLILLFNYFQMLSFLHQVMNISVGIQIFLQILANQGVFWYSIIAFITFPKKKLLWKKKGEKSELDHVFDTKFADSVNWKVILIELFN